VKSEYKKKLMQEAYTKLAQKRKNWPNKYDINLQLSKMLCDYKLLGKISLLNKKILNIGCSEPIDEIFWINLVKEWHALDINKSAIRVARKMALEVLSPKLYAKLDFIIGDVTHLELKDKYYDIVTSFSTIDHIHGKENRIEAIKQMHRVLKPGGHMVITVPNKWDIRYSYISNRLQRKQEAIFGYEYQFSPLELKKMLTSKTQIAGTIFAAKAWNWKDNQEITIKHTGKPLIQVLVNAPQISVSTKDNPFGLPDIAASEDKPALLE